MAPSAILALCLLALASATAAKNPELVPQIDAIMPEICTLSQGQGNKQVASLVAQTIEHLRVVPDDAVVGILDKIRTGQYCADHAKLESLFLDAVAFVGEPGAFKVMALELAMGRTAGGRFGLYTVAVNLLTQPTLDHVAALTPIFGMTDSNRLLSLAASTVVNRYCTQNADCEQAAPVQEILNVLSAKLDTQCTPDFSNVETTQVLTTLKSVGNIGKTTTALFGSVMKCALTEGIETNVQVASTLSLKGVSCMEPVTNGLKSVVLDSTKNTEVRIGSYLAAIHCVNEGDLLEVIDQMASETNKQVQGFILSHLENLKETNWPLKQNLHEILVSKNIPKVFMRNILKYSRNVEMSVNSPKIELGGLVESNVVYTPESYVPRLVNLGLNINLLGSFINIGEVGARVEGLDPYIEDAIGPNSYLYKKVFGPDSYLYKTPIWSIIEDSQLFTTQKGTEILHQIEELIRENNINADAVTQKGTEILQQIQQIIKENEINADTLSQKGTEIIKQIEQLLKENNIDADTIMKLVDTIIKNSKNVDVVSVVEAFDKVLKNAKNIDIKSVLSSVDFNSILQSIISFLKTNNIDVDSVVEAIDKVLKNAKNIDINSVLSSVDFDSIVKPVVSFIKTNKFQLPKTDLYAIIRAQERAFLSFGGEQNKFTILELLEPVIPVIMNVLAAAQNFNVDTTRTGQINIDYSIPTTSGIPLKLKLTGTGVAGIQLTNILNVKPGAIDALLKIIPSLNVIIEGHISFGELIDTKFKGSAYTTNGFALNVLQKNGEDLEIMLELPEKMELFDIESEVIILKPDQTSGEVKRFKSNQCSGITEPLTGLLVCYSMNVPNLMDTDRLPIGQQSMFRVYLEKSDPALKGYRLAAKLKNKPNNKFIKIVAETYGSADSKAFISRLSYNKKEDTYHVATNVKSSLLDNTCELTFINQPEYKSIQYYVSNKLASLSPLEGSVKAEFKPVAVENGMAYKVVIYTGLTKELGEKHRLFQIAFDILEKGDKTAAKLLAQTDIIPGATFAAVVEIPSNAGLKIYEVESIILTSTVSSIEVEAQFLKKSSEEYQTTLDIKKSGSSLAKFKSNNIIIIESPLIGFEATKLELRTFTSAKLPMVELSVDSRLAYSNGVIASSATIKHYSAELIILSSIINLDITSPALTIQIVLPFASMASQLGYTNGIIEGLSALKYMGSDVLAMDLKLSYVDYVVVGSSALKYMGSDALAMDLKLSYVDHVVVGSSALKYMGSDALAMDLKISYVDHVVVGSSALKYMGSDALTMALKLSYVDYVVDVSSDVTYFSSKIFSAYLKQTHAGLPLTFKTLIEVPNVLLVDLDQTVALSRLTALAKIELPFAVLSSKLGYTNGVIEGSSALKYMNSDALAMALKLSYVDYVVEVSSEVTYFSSKIFSAYLKQTHVGLPLTFKTLIEVPNVLLVDLDQTVDLSGITTLAQVEAPAVIKPLKIHNVFGISNAFSYSFLTHVTIGEAVVIHIEGPLTLAVSRSLVQLNLDLKISGAFDGTVKVMHGITFSLEKIQYLVDVRHTSTPIVHVDMVLDRSKTNELAGTVKVHIPLVIESDLAATITSSLIHTTLNSLVLPSTDYARRIKGYADFNWLVNNFKGELFWDAEKDNDKKFALSTKWALDTTAFKYLLQGELTVTTLTFGYKLESVLASPFELLQGNSGLEFTVTLPSQKMVIAKSMLDIQYGAAQVTLKPLIAIITADGNKYEVTSALVAKLLPNFLNFEVTCETTLSTPQLQQITHISKLVHEDKDESGMLAFEMILNESVLSQTCSIGYTLVSAPSSLKQTVRSKYGAKEVALLSGIVLKNGLQNFEVTHDLILPLESVKSCSIGYTLVSAPSALKQTVRAKLGAKEVALLSDIVLKNGLHNFEVTNDLILPLESVKSLTVNFIRNADGSNYLDFMVNKAKIISLSYTVPVLTKHDIGLTLPTRSFLFAATFSRNQINLTFFPEWNKSDKGVELILMIIPKASAVQFEALLTAQSLTKGLKFAVELGLIEPGKLGYDMVSIDVQYQVSETLELIKSVFYELQNIYVDLVKDGLLPDLNELYQLAQKLTKQLQEVLNNIRDQLVVMVPQYYEQLVVMVQQYYEQLVVMVPQYYEQLVVMVPQYYEHMKNYVLNLYHLHEADLIAFLQKIQSDLIMYWNIIKTETPLLINKYIEIIKKSETWHVVETTLNEVMVNYPAYYDAVVDFYNKVILTYLTDLSETVSQLLVLPEFDVSQYLVVIKTQMSTILNNVVSRLLDTQAIIILQEKFNELKTKAIIILQEKFNELKTKAIIILQEKFNELKSLFPVEFGILEDVYTKVLSPTFSQTLAIVKKLIDVPDLDFQKYLAIVISDVPKLLIKFNQLVLDTEVVQKLKTTFPVVIEIVKDLYNKIVIPTFNDITTFIQKVTALPVDIEVYWSTLQIEVPQLATQFVQRLLDTQIVKELTKIVKELRAAFPTVFEIAEDLHSKVILPTAEDVLVVVNKLISLPILDFKEPIEQYWNIIKVEIPKLFKGFVDRLPKTQLMMPEDLYKLVILPTIADVVVCVDKLVAVPVAVFQESIEQYWNIIKVEVPKLIKGFVDRLPNTQLVNELKILLPTLVNELKTLLPTLFVMSEDFYKLVILPTIADVVACIDKLVAVPVPDFHGPIEQYWNIIKVEVPKLFKGFVDRLPNAQLVMPEDLYKLVILPTIADVVACVDKLVAVPVADIQEAVTKYLDILTAEAPTLLSKLIQRIPNTQIMNLLQTNLVQLKSFLENNLVQLRAILENKFIELIAQYPEVYSVALDIYTKVVVLALDIYTKVVVPAISDVPLLYKTVIQLTDVTELGDFVVADLLSFVKNISINISTTDVFGELLVVFNQLVASHPDEYNTIVQTLKQIKEIYVSNNILTIQTYLLEKILAIQTYLLEKYGLSIIISSERFTAIIPLPVSLAIVHDYYQLIAVYARDAPALMIKALSQYVEQGRPIYHYIESQVPVVMDYINTKVSVVMDYINTKVPVVMDYINTQAPIYLQYVNDCIHELQVVIPKFINDIQVKLPIYLAPYVEEIKVMVETSYEMARKSMYAKLAEKKVKEIVELLLIKYNEVEHILYVSYPDEIKAVTDFVILYFNICLDYATWASNTVAEQPTVQKSIEYIQSLTLAKAQADLKPVVDLVMSALHQVEIPLNDLIAVLPKDIPDFVKLHIPTFFLTFLESVIMYIKQLL